MVSVNKKTIIGNWGLIGLLLIASLLWISVSQAWAENMTFRVSAHIIELERIQVGDVEGHFLGLVSRRGLAFLKNGEIAIYQGWETYDSDTSKGERLVQGYAQYRYKAGSTNVIRYRGTATAAQGGKTWLYKGTCEYIMGTGLFDGIKGRGSFTGKEVTPYSEETGTRGDLYLDFTVTYTLPSG